VHRITSLATILLAFFRFLSWLSSDMDPIAETSRPVVTRVYNSSQQPSRDGTFDFTVTGIRQSAPIAYVNAVIDLDDDGTINAYGIDEGVQQEWIVRNVPVPMTDDVLSDPRFSVWFDMSDMAIPLSSTKSCAVIITEKPLSVELPKPLADLKEWSRSRVKISNSNWGTQESIGQAPENPRQGFSSRPGKTVPLVHAGNGARSFAVPDIAQRSNECGPTSAANTLVWLSHEHQFGPLLPRNSDGSLDTSHLVLDLMKSMSGSIHRPYRGLKGNQMFSGLKAYVQEKGLPLSIGGGNEDDTSRGEHVLEFLSRHISNNEGVDLLVWLADGGGHWVTVTGFAREQGRAFLYVHDPDDKKTAQAVWEVTVDEHGNGTGEITSPRSCSTAWGVSVSLKPSLANMETHSLSLLPTAAWLRSAPDPDQPEPNFSAIEGTVSH
jgi:hypothetical protein